MLHHHRDNAIRECGRAENKHDNHSETAAIITGIIVIARTGWYKPVGSILTRSAVVVLFLALIV